ncbi:MAG: hypothetical protein M3N47_00395 [Chloroflexota bacterium]|nr:hypothetical protein [Chloroflexota bacterium]
MYAAHGSPLTGTPATALPCIGRRCSWSPLRGVRSHPLALLGVVEQLSHRGSKFFDVPGSDQQSLAAVSDELRQTARPRRDHRPPGGHRLECDDSEGLGPHRRYDAEEVNPKVADSAVGHRAELDDALCGGDIASRDVLSDEHERRCAGQPAGRLDEDEDAFFGA